MAVVSKEIAMTRREKALGLYAGPRRCGGQKDKAHTGEVSLEANPVWAVVRLFLESKYLISRDL